ncbi:fructose-bisphosphatase class III, partial [Salmonella enterica subsp. enterica serovar Typhimurium]
LSELAALVYYPEEKLKLITNQFTDKNELADWYKTKIEQLIELVAHSSSKYTRSKLRKALPQQFAYIIEELLYKK